MATRVQRYTGTGKYPYSDPQRSTNRCIDKKVFEHAAHLLANNAKQYISIQEGRKPDTTEICINKVVETIDGTFWTIDGFMSIID